MTNYYYAMAQLPAIVNGTMPALSYRKFLSLMEGVVGKRDYKLLQNLSLTPCIDNKKTGVAFLDRWGEYERSLRLALAKVRAEKLNWSLTREQQERFNGDEALDSKKIAREAIAIDDPMQAESFLTKARVGAAQALRGGNGFNRDALFSYAISLLLLERQYGFNVETGQTEYKAIYDKILEK